MRRIAEHPFYSWALTNWNGGGRPEKREKTGGRKRFTRRVKARAKTNGQQKDRRL